MQSTIIDQFEYWAKNKTDQKALIFLDSFGNEASVLTFGALYENAKRIASELCNRGHRRERVLLFFPQGVGFIEAFLGTLMSGNIAVPIPPPIGSRQKTRALPIIKDSGCTVILSEGEVAQKYADEYGLPSIDIHTCYDSATDLVLPRESDLAFLQYTSGSTSSPKGVMVAHGQLDFHQRLIGEAFNHSDKSIVVGWLPFYHDMGLVGNILHPIHAGLTSVLMSPLTFLNRPLSWLEAICKYKGTTSGGPNFAYDLCVAKIGQEELARLDLSSWKVAFNGAEKVHHETIRAFSKKFSACHFSDSAFFPCYGLAEATLFVTGGHYFQDPSTSLEVGCGATRRGERVCIVDPETMIRCQDGVTGEIFIQGRSVTQGYWNNPDQTKQSFGCKVVQEEGEFLRTGDLGYIKNNQLFPVGRLKNLIIIRGKNYIPEDLERTLTASHSVINSRRAAVFSVEKDQKEVLIVVQEIPRTAKEETLHEEITKSMVRAFSQGHGIVPDEIVLVRENSLPRTTSGKLQIFVTREQYLEGKLKIINKSSARSVNTSSTIASQNLLQICSQLCRCSEDSIDANEPLINLGVDSMGAVQLSQWIAEKYGRSVDLAEVLEGASLRDLEKLIESSPVSDIKEISSNDSSRKQWSLTSNQESVWAVHKLDPSTTSYNIVASVRIKGEIDQDLLDQSLSDVVRRHGILSGACIDTALGPMFQIEDGIIPPISFEKVSSTHAIGDAIRHETQHIFDLEKPPLFRLRLLEIDGGDKVLVSNFHHLITDGASMNILLEDLLTALYARHSGHEPLFMPVVQYVEFSSLVSDRKETDHFKKGLQYWRQLLGNDVYPTLELSPFRTQPENESILIDETVTLEIQQQIGAICKELRLTPAIIFLAVYHALLHYYSGQSDTYIGYPSMNRRDVKFSKTVGFFVNTLVSRTRRKIGMNFVELLEIVKNNLRHSAEYDDIPFQDILQELSPERIEGISPLFQAFFVMQNASFEPISSGELGFELQGTYSSAAMYDVVLEVQRKLGKFQLVFEFDQTKVSRSVSEAFVNQYMALLSHLLVTPQESIASCILPGAIIPEREQYDLPYDNIIDAIEHQSVANPDRIAIDSDLGVMTYKQISEKSSKLAKLILDQGVKPGEMIGIFLPREPNLIVSLLAIIKSGCAYVPLDLSLPEDRINTILRETGMKVILSKTKSENIPHFDGMTINPDELDNLVELSSSQCKATGLAYVLFTSGSTGVPKGVMVENRSLINFALYAVEFFSLTSSSRVLQFSSINWDTASEEIYPTLIAGGTVVLRSNARLETYDELLKRTTRYHVSVWNLPTSYFNDLVDLLVARGEQPPQSLELVIIGGERVSAYHVEKWMKLEGNNSILLNTYGATETTSITSTFNLANWKSDWLDAPIGKPIGNVGVSVINDEGVALPPGIVGELVVTGAGVSRGYLNNQAHTDSVFEFTDISRKYKTGDQAYFDLSGNILIRGRKDSQIKRRGFRIELADIESNLKKVAKIEAAAVISAGKEIWAFVVMEPGGSVLDVCSDFRRLVPDYMFPEKIVPCDRIPRLISGKIDVQQLVLWGKEYENTANDQIHSMSDCEEIILGIWQRVIGKKDFSIFGHFFDVGANSLLLIKLHAELEREFGIKFNVSQLFSHTTIQAQAQFVQGLEQQKGQRQVKPIDRLELLEQLHSGNLSISNVKEALNETHKG